MKYQYYVHNVLLTYEQATDFLDRKNTAEGREWRIPTLEEVFEALMKIESGSLRGYLSDIEAEELQVWVQNPDTAVTRDKYVTCNITPDGAPTESESPKSQPRVVLLITTKEEE